LQGLTKPLSLVYISGSEGRAAAGCKFRGKSGLHWSRMPDNVRRTCWWRYV